MPDQAAIDGLATKFEAWARTLSTDEQVMLAQWIGNASGNDVEAYRDANWWQENGAWARAWTETQTTW